MLIFIMKGKRSRICNTILKKYKVGRLIWLDFNTYYNTYLRQCDIGKRPNRTMEQNSPKDRPTQKHSTDLWQRRKSDTMAKEIFSSAYSAKTGHPRARGKKLI